MRGQRDIIDKAWLNWGKEISTSEPLPNLHPLHLFPFLLGFVSGRNPHYNQRMMQLTVRLFALYRERAGVREFPLELPDGATVADLTDAVRHRFPRLAPPDVKIVVAVNADYAEPQDILHAGDDVCLIPPVSGG